MQKQKKVATNKNKQVVSYWKASELRTSSAFAGTLAADNLLQDLKWGAVTQIMRKLGIPKNHPQSIMVAVAIAKLISLQLDAQVLGFKLWSRMLELCGVSSGAMAQFEISALIKLVFMQKSEVHTMRKQLSLLKDATQAHKSRKSPNKSKRKANKLKI